MSLKPEGYKPRLIDKTITDSLKTFGAVSVEGPKWCGKTWAARNAANSEIQVNSKNEKLLKTDISYAFKGEEPRLIDEWQFVPELWDETRFEVDRSTIKGRFILCGSSTPDRKSKKHSGAGRICTLTLHTMSLFETEDSDGFASLSNLFDNSMENSSMKEIKLEHLISLMLRGGWPGLLDSNTDPVIANRDYLNKLCKEDSINIDGVQRNPHKMKLLIKSIARNESTVVSDERLRKDIAEYDNESISESTLADYKNVLESLNILSYQPAFNPYLRSSVRVGKSPKKHLADPSLSMSALGMNSINSINDLETLGFIFESLCEHDLGIYAEYLGGNLYHYRDNNGYEIDAIVELPDGRWGAFEIKLGFNQVDKAAEELLKLNKRFIEEGKPPEFLCVICGMSSAAYRRNDGVYVVPITRLGP